jgi:hypothetical protein
MEQRQKKSKPQRVERKKRLNIVYFVDSSRTRSFSISLNRVRAILAVAGGIVTWALVGTGFVYYLVRENIQHRTNYRSALTAIFDYQSRYDGVYERAYPDGRQLRAAADNAVENKKPGGQADSDLGDADFSVGHADVTKTPAKQEVVKIPAKPVAIQPEASKASIPKAASAPIAKPAVGMDAKTAEQAAAPAEWMIDLEKPSVEKKGQGFDLNFALRNRQKDAKADGYVWAIATVMRESGETVYFPAPLNLAIDRFGNAVDGHRAHKFSIKHYKAKKFSFRTPEGVSGILTNIDIGLMNQDGTSKVFKVPLKFKVDLPVPQPEGTGTGPESDPSAKSDGEVDEPDEQGA